MSGDSVAEDQIRSYFERWKRLEGEKDAISTDLRELFAEMKGNGFDTKVARKVFRDKEADPTERSEFEAIYDLYWVALSGPRAGRARERFENADTEPQPQAHSQAAQSLPDRTGPLTSPDRREGDDDGQFIQPETATRGEAQVTAAATGVSPVIRAAGDTGAQPAGGEDETAPESGAHSSAAGKPGPVQTGPALALVYTFTSKPHDGPHSSNGQPRMKGCLNLDACAGTHSKRCYGCERAWMTSQSEPESAA